MTFQGTVHGSALIFQKVQIFSKNRLTKTHVFRIIAHVERLTPQNKTEYWGFA